MSVDAAAAPAVVRLSVGADDGVVRGQRFAIDRDGKLLGAVEVVAVLEDGCSCRQVSIEKGCTIQAGDHASLKTRQAGE